MGGYSVLSSDIGGVNFQMFGGDDVQEVSSLSNILKHFLQDIF
jgi:hypothetical protein